MAGHGEQPNMDKESGISDCGEPPAGVHQWPENSHNHSVPRRKKRREFIWETIPVRKRTVITKAQMKTLKAFFKRKKYVTLAERKLLANQLSVLPRQIKTWFYNQRERLRYRQALNPTITAIQDQAGNSSALSTPWMPIAPDNANKESSTDASLVTEEAKALD